MRSEFMRRLAERVDHCSWALNSGPFTNIIKELMDYADTRDAELDTLKAENESLRAKVASVDRLANAVAAYDAVDAYIVPRSLSAVHISKLHDEMREALAKFKGDK